MYPKTDVLFKMIREIINTSSLKDTKRLHEIIAQVKSRAQSSLVSAGHSTAVLRAASYTSPNGCISGQNGRYCVLPIY